MEKIQAGTDAYYHRYVTCYSLTKILKKCKATDNYILKLTNRLD